VFFGQSQVFFVHAGAGFLVLNVFEPFKNALMFGRGDYPVCHGEQDLMYHLKKYGRCVSFQTSGFVKWITINVAKSMNYAKV